MNPAERTKQQAESLSRAIQGVTMSNYPAIFEGFMAKGISESDIRPRENVFTFNAWKALGRSVKKGEHGVKVVTWVDVKGKKADDQAAAFENGESNTVGYRMCKTTTVFHVSQTEVRN